MGISTPGVKLKAFPLLLNGTCIFNDISNTEILYTHPNLPYTHNHNITVGSNSPSSGVEVTVTFYIGEIVSRIEKLTDTGINYNAAGITRIGYKTTKISLPAF